jgi:hypothetical protein
MGDTEATASSKPCTKRNPPTPGGGGFAVYQAPPSQEPLWAHAEFFLSHTKTHSLDMKRAEQHREIAPKPRKTSQKSKHFLNTSVDLFNTCQIYT